MSTYILNDDVMNQINGGDGVPVDNYRNRVSEVLINYHADEGLNKAASNQGTNNSGLQNIQIRIPGDYFDTWGPV
jgi:hypothetical protein